MICYMAPYEAESNTCKYYTTKLNRDSSFSSKEDVTTTDNLNFLVGFSTEVEVPAKQVCFACYMGAVNGGGQISGTADPNGFIVSGPLPFSVSKVDCEAVTLPDEIADKEYPISVESRTIEALNMAPMIIINPHAKCNFLNFELKRKGGGGSLPASIVFNDQTGIATIDTSVVLSPLRVEAKFTVRANDGYWKRKTFKREFLISCNTCKEGYSTDLTVGSEWTNEHKLFF